MKMVTTREAQHHLRKILTLVESGEEVVITRRGKKVARLSSIGSGADEEAVNWPNATQKIREALSDLPVLEGNSVLLMRDETSTPADSCCGSAGGLAEGNRTSARFEPKLGYPVA